MGFKQGAYAKVWSVEPGASGKYTKARISIQRKLPDGAYDQEFSEFITLIGEANHKARAGLKEGDRIKIGSVDVTTRYDKNVKKQYTNFLVFNYEMAEAYHEQPAMAEANPADGGDNDPEEPASVQTDLPGAAPMPEDTDIPF